MRLYFKQRFFSWFDSYDIYNENGDVLYTVQGQMAWGHKLQIYNASGQHVGTLREQILTFLPRFDIHLGDEHVGTITKQFTFFKPSFSLDCNGWNVEGNFWEWDYSIRSNSGVVARIEKQFLSLTDTYLIDVLNPGDSLLALMIVLAIDAVKCGKE